MIPRVMSMVIFIDTRRLTLGGVSIFIAGYCDRPYLKSNWVYEGYYGAKAWGILL